MAQEWENEAIKAAGRRWQDAYSRGDTGGMESAHAEAEALRAKAGYSGGTNGDKRISLNTSSPSSGLGYGVRPVTYDAEAEIARNNYIRSLATGETPVPVSRNDKLYIEPRVTM